MLHSDILFIYNVPDEIELLQTFMQLSNMLANTFITAKYTRDWSIFSSKFPKQYASLFDYSRVCKSCEPEIVIEILQIKTETLLCF